MSLALSFTCAYTYASPPSNPTTQRVPSSAMLLCIIEGWASPRSFRLKVPTYIFPAAAAALQYHCRLLGNPASRPPQHPPELDWITSVIWTRMKRQPLFRGERSVEKSWTATFAATAAGQRESREEQSWSFSFFFSLVVCFKGPRRLSVSLPACLHAFPQLAAVPAEPQ